MTDYVVLGMVQGLTELLPISSSGHLVLVGNWLGIESPGLALEVMLHLGTLLAVVWAFRGDVARLLAGVVGRDPAGLALFGQLVLATVPVVVCGPLLRDPVHTAFASPRLASVMLMATGVMLLVTRLIPPGERPLDRRVALSMGLAQIAALLPGISRSGATMVGGFAAGVPRREVARFSFLMSIPAILGAVFLEALTMQPGELARLDLPSMAAGVTAAFVAGLIAIRVLLKLLDRRRFEWFGVYCLVIGALSLVIG